MTISSTIRKAGPFPGNGSTVALPFTFKVFTAADVLAVKADTATGVETTLTLGTDYTVSVNTDQNTTPGGTLTLTSAHATGTTVTLTTRIENIQAMDLTNLGGFYPKVINDALDRTTIQIQQLAEQASRTVKLPISSTANPDDYLKDVQEAVVSAASSAGASVSSASDAAASASEARSYLLTYRTTSYGALSADPDLDPAGNAPTVGDEYFNTTANLLKRFNGATWQASDISTANLATGGGAALVGFKRNEAGAVLRTVQSKNADILNVHDFGAVADGTSHPLSERFTTLASAQEVYPHAQALTDEIDWAALQAGANALTFGQTLEARGGTLVINKAWDLLSLAQGASVEIKATIYAPSVALAVAISVDRSDVFIKRLIGNDAANSKAALIVSSFRSNINIETIEGFQDGIEANGTYAYKGRNGTIYCNIDSRNITVTGKAYEQTTDMKAGGTKPGYVNENIVTIRWMNASDGIKLTKSAGALYKYDGNSYMMPGFEQINGDAFSIEFATRNALFNPRFENIAGKHIKEAADCSRNQYYLHFTPGWDHIEMNGILSTMHGSIVGTHTVGDTTSFQTTQTDTPGQTIHFAASHLTTLKPNTLYYKDKYGYLFRDRIECLDAAGALSHIRLHRQIGATTAANITAAAYSVPVGTELIQLSAAVQAQVITMPVEMERNGNSLLLNVAAASVGNNIQLKKSTGTTTATITASGLYMLIYALDGWRVSNIGTAF